MKTINIHPRTRSLFSGLAIAAFLQSSAHAALIHHWEFNEGTGTTTADSAGSIPGTITGATWACNADHLAG